MPISAVADGTEIDPAWGNAVATAINAHEDAWTSHTLVWSNLTLGNGTVSATYNVIGKTVVYRGSIIFGSTTSVTGTVSVSMPVTPIASIAQTGPLRILDSGVRHYTGSVISSGSSLFFVHTETGNTGLVNATNPFTFGTSDEMNWSITYESS